MAVVSETADTQTTTPSVFGIDDEALPTRTMVFGLAHRDGTVHGSELYPTAVACGIGIETVRSCMRRLTGEGLFEREGEGRDAVFRATNAGRVQLDVTAQRHLLAYAQDAAGRGWDRRWRIVAFAIPEAQRTARDELRDHLRALGGAAIQPGLYVSPHAWDAEVHLEAERLGLREHVSTFSSDDLELCGVRDPREMARSLWPLDEVADRYRSFIDSYRDVPELLSGMRRRGHRISEADFLPGVLHLAVRFNACFELDPLLPPELLPRPWPGKEARELLARCRKLGVLTRQDKAGPALFRVFDDAIAHLP